MHIDQTNWVSSSTKGWLEGITEQSVGLDRASRHQRASACWPSSVGYTKDQAQLHPSWIVSTSSQIVSNNSHLVGWLHTARANERLLFCSANRFSL